MKTRIIAFSNTAMRDDGVGNHVARELAKLIEAGTIEADLVESSVAGYALFELLDGWERAILVEAVKMPGHEPGAVLSLDPLAEGMTLRLRASREADLPSVLQAGARLGFAMPEEILLYGIQCEDLCTFGDELTPSVAAAVPRAVEAIVAALRESRGRPLAEPLSTRG